MSKKEAKDIYIDADFLIYKCTESRENKTAGFSKRFGGRSLSKKIYKAPLKPFKDKLKGLVKDIIKDISIQTSKDDFKIGDTYLVFTPKKNFRDDIYPAYKANRAGKEKAPEFKRLKKWAIKKNMMFKGFEADDYVSLMARAGHITASFDKDVYRSSEGIFYNPHHKHLCIIRTSKEEAERFTLIQTLTGDPTDNILALPKIAGNEMIDGVPRTDGTRKPFKVTEKLAIELLDEFGWDWKGVVKAFKSKGFGKKEALLNRRLVGMDQMVRCEVGKGYELKLFKS